MVGTFREPSGGRRVSPIHSIYYSVAQPLERGFKNYYSIIQGKTMKSRLVVLTDICRGLENDDIESMVRLLLYSNEINLEGLIAATSCWAKKAATEKERKLILKIVNAYACVRENLSIHADGYPDPDGLRRKVCCGVAKYGRCLGDGFGEASLNESDGVRLIIDAADQNDERPLWIAIWSGANTLA